MRSQTTKICGLAFLAGTVCAHAQVMTAPALWTAPAPTLTISDGPTYDYGNILNGSSADKAFTISNDSAGIASSMTGAAFSTTKYSFKGGTFPGTGGTCTGPLKPGENCTVVVAVSSTTGGTFADSMTVNYGNGRTNASVSRALTSRFISGSNQLSFTTAPDFLQVGACVPVVIEAQDEQGVPITVGNSTSVSFTFNNSVNSAVYSDANCTNSISSRNINSGNSSRTIYLKSTTASQSGILVATASGFDSASHNFTVTGTPTKLFLSVAPQIRTSVCTAITVFATDASGMYSAVVSGATTVNLTESGNATFYSNSSCSSAISQTTISSGAYAKTIYVRNATVQTINLTATDPGGMLSPSIRSVAFVSALTWWNSSFGKRIRIDINNADQAQAFADQPVLVTLTSSVVDYADILASGADIRFVAADNSTVLAHEVEKWTVGGTSYIWVRIPSIAASSNTGHFFMYYGNSAATDAQDKTAIWSNYWATWHLGENPSNSAPQYLDSTSNARHGTKVNNPSRQTGFIGYGAGLLSANDAIQINTGLEAVLGGSSTFSCWMKTSQAGQDIMWQAPGLTGVESFGDGNDIFFGWLDAAGNIGVTAGDGAAAKSGYIVNNNAWRHVTITRNSTTGQVVFYVNGVQTASSNSATGTKTTPFNLLGEIGDTAGTPMNYDGMMDEVRIVSSVRSAAQILGDFKFMMNTHLNYNAVELP